MADEKREIPRIQPFVTSCHVVDGTRRFGAYLTDLSLTGARISCDASPPRPEAWVTLEVRLGRAREMVRLQAQVRWTGLARSAHRFGVTFHLDEEGQRRLGAVVEEFHRRAAELA